MRRSRHSTRHCHHTTGVDTTHGSCSINTFLMGLRVTRLDRRRNYSHRPQSNLRLHHPYKMLWMTKSWMVKEERKACLDTVMFKSKLANRSTTSPETDNYGSAECNVDISGRVRYCLVEKLCMRTSPNHGHSKCFRLLNTSLPRTIVFCCAIRVLCDFLYFCVCLAIAKVHGAQSMQNDHITRNRTCRPTAEDPVVR